MTFENLMRKFEELGILDWDKEVHIVKENDTNTPWAIVDVSQSENGEPIIIFKELATVDTVLNGAMDRTGSATGQAPEHYPKILEIEK